MDDTNETNDSNVMGGNASTDLSISNPTSNAIVVDPGQIATSSQNNQNTSRSSSLGMPAYHNITISAEDIKKELQSDDLQDVLGNKHLHDASTNVFSSLVKKTTSAIEKSQIAHNAAMEKQVVEQHRLNDKRYRGYPILKEGGEGDSGATTNADSTGTSSSHAPSFAFQPEPCVGGKFYVTKLRNWRTGYDRILSLHHTYFTTLDPETNEITNLWTYNQVKQYSILPNEEGCFIIDIDGTYSGSSTAGGINLGGSSTKLKLKCLAQNLQYVLTSFAARKYMNDVNNIMKTTTSTSATNNANTNQNYYQQKELYQRNPMFECQRQTRNNKKIKTLLVCAPHGVLELDAATRSSVPIQTYLYRNMKAVSFVSDNQSGIVFYMGGVDSVPMNSTMPPHQIYNHNESSNNESSNDSSSRICDEKIFYVASIRPGGSGRGDMLMVLKSKIEALGLPFIITESVAIHTSIERKLQRANISGEHTANFKVIKCSQRRQYIQGDNGFINRSLIITGFGYLMEYDTNGTNIVSCRNLVDLCCLVRHSSISDAKNQNELFSIEFKDGTVRSYSSQDRDTILVSILDVAVNLCRNYNVTITDVPSLGYRFLSPESSFVVEKQVKSNDVGIFQPDPIEVICFRRLFNVASTTKSYLKILLFSETFAESCLDICYALVQSCREFNANVSIASIRNLPQDENHIVPVIYDLWNVVLFVLNLRDKFKCNDENISHSAVSPKDRTSEEVDLVLCVIFQSLYRLMLTSIGYCRTKEIEEVIDVLARKLYCINDVFTLYWSLKCASALLLPRPFAAERDEETESKNKCTLMNCIPNLAKFLVNNESFNQTKGLIQSSELLLMVISNILESILCSHRDTTREDYYAMLMDELSDGYQNLMLLLQSKASIIVENVVIFLHLITSYKPKTVTLLKDVALGSGILLYHLYNALFSDLEGQRTLCRSLCTIWFSGPSDCLEKQLLQRIIPAGFLPYLAMPILSDAEEEQLNQIDKGSVKGVNRHLSCDEFGSCGSGTNIGRLRQRLKVLSSDESNKSKSAIPKENFRIYFHVLYEDHSLPDLIWNETTRHDLQKCIEKELRTIQVEMIARGGMKYIAWNHHQFQVDYVCLRDEIKVGKIYLRLWLDTGESFIKSWNEPVQLFELLLRRLICDIDRDITVTNLCIRSLERLYSAHAVKIGIFPDIMVLVRLMQTTRATETRHRLLSLIVNILGKFCDINTSEHTYVIGNADQMLNKECINCLCQLVAWGNLQLFEDDNMNTSIHDQSETSKSTSEINVPAIWLIAQAGNNPPKSDDIIGPFNIKMLDELISKGDIGLNTLVSTVESEGLYVSLPSISDCRKFGDKEWTEMNQVSQLKWQLLSDSSSSKIYSASEIASLALKCLDRLVEVHRSTDSRGIPLFPMPIAKRLITSPSVEYVIPPLSIISQAILSDDASVVELASKLIRNLMNHNEKVCSELYMTGVFYFSLLINGSHFKSIANLLCETHTKQRFHCGPSGFDERSYLETMLPMGLINVLKQNGAESFSDAFLSTIETPEVIWSLEMKNYLQMMIKEHLGFFPLRLKECITDTYRYCPIPKIKYENLKGDIFCHKYYLKNLCDENRFPQWHIEEPLEVFRQSLISLQDILSQSQKTKNLSLEEARTLIGLKVGDDTRALRLAYVALMRSIHTEEDRNEELHEQIFIAYEQLNQYLQHHKIIESVPLTEPVEKSDDNDSDGLHFALKDLNSIHLLLKTQLLIYKRYPDDLDELKYPSYSFLLSCLNFSSKEGSSFENDEALLKCCLLRKRRYELIRTSVNLIFNSCLVSPLNAEELIRENGLSVLDSMLNFYLKALSILTNEKEDEEVTGKVDIVMDIVVTIVHTISGVAYFESGREAIISLDTLRFCSNWKKCIDLQFLHSSALGCNLLKRYALEGIASLSKNDQLQRILVGSHVTWSLLSSMLKYDPSLDTSPYMTDEFERNISKTEENFQAFLATRALGMLCGVIQKDDLETNSNGVLCNAMKHILTQPLARMLSNSQSEELLQTLNLNVASSLRLWDGSMREELMSFVNKMETKYQNLEYQDSKDALADCSNFEYSNLSNEVNIGGVYIRIFNNMDIREAVRDLPNISHFARSLVEFIGRSIEKSATSKLVNIESVIRDENDIQMEEENHWFRFSDDRFVMAVRSVLHLVELDGVVDDVMCEHEVIKILFHLLDLPSDNEACGLGHELLLLMSQKKTFADSVSSCSGVIRTILTIIESETSDKSPDENSNGNLHQQRRWLILENLACTPSVANLLITSSVWLELLGIITCYFHLCFIDMNRRGAAKVLSKLLWEPTTSSVTVPLVQRFLPSTLVTILKDKGPEALLTSLDSDSEMPELIWNSSLKEELKLAIDTELDQIISNVSNDSVNCLQPFTLDSMFSVKYKQLEDELEVGGVYVRLFLKNSSYQLRDPTGFLETLMASWARWIESLIATKANDNDLEYIDIKENLKHVTDTCNCLCKHSYLCVKLAPWGYMRRAVSFLHGLVEQGLISYPLVSVFQVLHCASLERVNVESLINACDSDGKNGIVDGIKKSIGSAKLNPHSCFFLETLRNITKDTLGDVSIQIPDAIDTMISQPSNQNQTLILPSPGPGTDPVKKMEKLVGDDPLSMLLGETQPLPNSTPVQPNKPALSQGKKASQVSIPKNMPLSKIQAPNAPAKLQGVGHAQAFQNQSQRTNQPVQQQFSTVRDGVNITRDPSLKKPIMLPQTASSSFRGQDQKTNYLSQQPMAKSTVYRPMQYKHPVPGRGIKPLRSQDQFQPQSRITNSPPTQFQSNTTFTHSSNSSNMNPQPYNNIPKVQNNQYSIEKSEMLRSNTSTIAAGSMINSPNQMQSIQYRHHHSSNTHVQHQAHQIGNNFQQHGAGRQLYVGSNSMHYSPSQQAHYSMNAQNNNNNNIAQQFQARYQLPSTNQLIQPQQYISPQVSNHSNYNQGVEHEHISVNVNDNYSSSNAQSVNQSYNDNNTIDPSPPQKDPKVIAEEKMKSSEGAPGCAKGRKSFLSSVLSYEMIPYLITNVLENESLVTDVLDYENAKLHVIEIIKLLLMDPGFGLMFRLQLDSIPEWEKYKSQCINGS